MADNKDNKKNKGFDSIITPSMLATYKNLIASRESSGELTDIGKRGGSGNFYIGRYQIGPQALEDIGLLKKGSYKKYGAKAIDDPNNWTEGNSLEKLLTDREYQEKVMDDYTKKNFNYLAKTFEEKDIEDPVEILGYLAGAHLTGWGATKKYINSGKDSKDAFNTKLSDYENYIKDNFITALEATKEGINIKYDDKTKQPIYDNKTIDPFLKNQYSLDQSSPRFQDTGSGEIPENPIERNMLYEKFSSNPENRTGYSPEMLNALQNSGNNPSLNNDFIEDDTNTIEEYNIASRGRLNTFYGITEPNVVEPKDTDALTRNMGRPDMNEARYGGRQLTNKYNLGGGLLNEFNEGGTHEENPIGGIPQGIGPNGKLNTVEEGETKYENYVFSDTLKVTKEDVKTLLLPKKLEGKTFAEASRYLNKFVEDDPNNIITKKTIRRQLDSLILGNEKAKALFENESNSIPDQNQMFLGGDEDATSPQTNGDVSGSLINLNNTGAAVGGLASGVAQMNATLNAEDPNQVSPVGSALSMAGSGAAIGSIIPGVGTAVGAGVGAVAGLVTGIFGKKKARERERRRLRNQAIKNANMAVSDFKLGGRLNQYINGGPIGTGLNYMGDWDDSDLRHEEVLMKQISPLQMRTAPSTYLTPTTKESDFKELELRNTPKSNFKSQEVGYKYGQGTHPLQFANVLGSILNYRDARRLKPDIERLNRINTRINPRLIDERSLLNTAENAMNTSINAILGASGGSGASARAGILGSGINYNRGLSEATLQAQNYNNLQRLEADKLNLGTQQFNVKQDNLERDINAREKDAVRAIKARARQVLFDSISGVGKELTYDRRLRSLTGGYDNSGYDPENLIILKRLGII